MIAISGDRLFVKIEESQLASKPLSSPNANWAIVDSTPVWPNFCWGTADRLIASNTNEVISRSVYDPNASWAAIAPLPREHHFLTIQGERMIACGGIGSIVARRLSDLADAPWTTIGTIRKPSR